MTTTASLVATNASIANTTVRPRLGFLGVGWIGRHRMEAIARSGVAEVTLLSDTSHEAATLAAESIPGGRVAGSLEEMIDAGVDGIVIATPSAMHAEQAIAALERGVAVFCQKPLARTAVETWRVINAARSADRLLGVDLSYRFTDGMQTIREIVRRGDLGRIFAVDLVFHNAYGPDKSWFYDPQLSGGGCVMDLGIHMVDLALWTLDFPRVGRVESRLFAGGEPLDGIPGRVEDYAVARIDLDTGATVRIACSWKLAAGRDAVIEATFYGTSGGATFRNVNGSFYNFTAEQFQGTSASTRTTPGEEWGGRAAIAWATQLATDRAYDPSVERVAQVAETLDAIYGRGTMMSQ